MIVFKIALSIFTPLDRGFFVCVIVSLIFHILLLFLIALISAYRRYVQMKASIQALPA